jgi:hypothetical protein
MISRRLWVAAAAAGMAAAMGGCLVTNNARTETSGRRVTESGLAGLEPGVATEEVVVTTLGPPTTRHAMSDGSELWEYVWEERRKRDSAVFLLFGSSSDDRKEHRAFVHIRGGVVERAWRQ